MCSASKFAGCHGSPAFVGEWDWPRAGNIGVMENSDLVGDSEWALVGTKEPTATAVLKLLQVSTTYYIVC